MLIKHPPLRICVTLLAIIVGVSVQHLTTLFLFIGFGQLWLFICRVPIFLLWQRFKLVLPFIVFSLLFFTLYEQDHYGGFEKALIYDTRLLFTIQMLTLMFYHMPLSVLFESLARLKIPSIFIELIQFTLRFIGVIRIEAIRMLQALRSRGMRKRSFFSWLQSDHLDPGTQYPHYESIQND